MPFLRFQRRAVRQGTPFGLPFRQAAIQHGHILMAHHLEHPPGARRREQARHIIGDHPLAIADPQLPHARGEFLRARQHVGKRARGIGEIVDIENLRPRNMAFQELGPGIALHGGQVPGGIDDGDVGRIQMGFEPFGGDEIAVHANTNFIEPVMQPFP